MSSSLLVAATSYSIDDEAKPEDSEKNGGDGGLTRDSVHDHRESSRVSVRAVPSICGRGSVAERGVPATVVVVLLPVADHDSRVSEAVETVQVQALVANAGIERFHVAVAPRLTGWNVGNPHHALRPIGQGLGDELGPVVASQHSWQAAPGNDRSAEGLIDSCPRSARVARTE